MYPVSSAFMNAMKAPTQEYQISGTIGNVSFTQSNILSGAFSITNQCSDDSELTIGSVYVGELDATFINLNIPRYDWYGAEITVYFGPVGFDPIPMGVYTIAEAEWSASGTVVKAYDNMAKFDKKYNGYQYAGTPYEIIDIICEDMEVPLGMTEQEMEALPNGDQQVAIFEENDIETYRDLISWFAQLMGGFATIDRTGQLVIRNYGATVVDTVDSTIRFTGAAFSDYQTRYTGLSYADLQSGMTNYYHVDPDDGLVYNLGSNPFIQYGTQESKDDMAEAILQSLQNIQYVPFNATSTSNPAYDLGDVIRFTGGIADNTKKSCVTKFTFNYNGGYQMTGVGKNPTLASAKSKTDKDISGLISRVNSNKSVIVSYVNAGTHSIGEDEEFNIATLNFVTLNASSKIDVWIEFNPYLYVGESYDYCSVYFRYYLDNELDTHYYPGEYIFHNGPHIFSLHYFIGDLEENKRYKFNATVTIVHGSGLIVEENTHALLRGDGIAGDEIAPWDGNIEAFDDINRFNVWLNTGIYSFSDNANVSLQTPMAINPSDTVSRFVPYNNISVRPITESVSIEFDVG